MKLEDRKAEEMESKSGNIGHCNAILDQVYLYDLPDKDTNDFQAKRHFQRVESGDSEAIQPGKNDLPVER